MMGLRGVLFRCVVVVLALVSADASFASESAAKKPPNILLIMADDLGYGDLECYGATDIHTPNIDSIAKAGVRFTSAYAYPTCSPTRASLMTGRYAERLGISKALMGEDAPKMQQATTVAQLLKDKGYVTGLVGKWHLGYTDDVSPLNKGFDEFFGFRGGKIDFFTHTDTAQKDGSKDGKHDLWEGNAKIRRQGYATDLFTGRAKQFLRTHAGKDKPPFFLFLAHPAPHYGRMGLWQAPEPYLKMFNAVGQTKGRDVYRAMVVCLDDRIGEVLEELEAQGATNDTLVIFMSDNGPDKPGSAKPLSGGKFTYREGGIRVPLVARLPGVIPPGTIRDDAIHAIDFAPTALAIAGGGKPPAGVTFDGTNVWPAFVGGPRVPDRSLYFSDVALRRGEWKVFRDQLFNVRVDITESTDLAAKHPDIRDRLAKERREWATSVGIEPTTKPVGKPGFK